MNPSQPPEDAPMERATIVAGIAAAAQELTALTASILEQIAHLRALQRRARQLEAFIASGQTVLGEDPGGRLPVVPRQQPPVRAQARFVLETFQRPMRAQEMATYLQQQGLREGKWTRELLRNAMRHSPDFECIAKGLYALREWPSAQKALRDACS